MACDGANLISVQLFGRRERDHLVPNTTSSSSRQTMCIRQRTKLRIYTHAHVVRHRTASARDDIGTASPSNVGKMECHVRHTRSSSYLCIIFSGVWNMLDWQNGPEHTAPPVRRICTSLNGIYSLAVSGCVCACVQCSAWFSIAGSTFIYTLFNSKICVMFWWQTPENGVISFCLAVLFCVERSLMPGSRNHILLFHLLWTQTICLCYVESYLWMACLLFYLRRRCGRATLLI